MRKSILKYALIALLFAGAAVTGCKKESTSPAESSSSTSTSGSAVSMKNNAFNPSSLTVSVNTTVTWTNQDNTAHTVTSNSGVFDSGTINAGGTYSYKFTTKGTYDYHCNFHSMMTGTVVVQ